MEDAHFGDGAMTATKYYQLKYYLTQEAKDRMVKSRAHQESQTLKRQQRGSDPDNLNLKDDFESLKHILKTDEEYESKLDRTIDIQSVPHSSSVSVTSPSPSIPDPSKPSLARPRNRRSLLLACLSSEPSSTNLDFKTREYLK